VRRAAIVRLRGPARGFAIAAVLLSPAMALAHEAGLSRGDYSMEGASVRADLAFARKDVARLVAGLDVDHDGTLTEAEVLAARDSMKGAIVGRVKVEGDGSPCPGELDRVELVEQDGLVVHAKYRCKKRPSEARVTLALLDDLPYGHRHLARAFQAEGPLDLVLSQRVQGFAWRPPFAPSPPPEVGASKLAQHGATHAATTWTLPVLLLGLLVRCEARRASIVTAIAFASALAVGLIASATGAFTPSPRAIAIAIAAALIYVAVDAPWSAESRARGAAAWLALPFGAIHGLGFAAALRVANGATPWALGALAIVAAISIVLVLISPRARKHPAIVRGLALLAGALSLARVFYLGS
jgi:hypothetical protein